MVTQCPSCGERTALPADGGRALSPCVLCKRCGDSLTVDSRYWLCLQCRRFYRGDYETCPIYTVEGISVLTTLAEGQLWIYTVEPKRRKTRRGDDYYWQLYLDYGDKSVVAPEVSPLEPPAAKNDVVASSEHEVLASGPSLQSDGNGATNGQYANGSAPVEPGRRVDLAMTETVPLTLFTESSAVEMPSGEQGATKTAGNYNDFEHELIQDQSRLAEVAELLANETMLGLDTETTGLDPHTSELLLLQISTVD